MVRSRPWQSFQTVSRPARAQRLHLEQKCGSGLAGTLPAGKRKMAHAAVKRHECLAQNELGMVTQGTNTLAACGPLQQRLQAAGLQEALQPSAAAPGPGQRCAGGHQM